MELENEFFLIVFPSALSSVSLTFLESASVRKVYENSLLVDIQNSNRIFILIL